MLMLRGTTESGLVSEDQYIQKVMVTAKSNIEE